MNDGGSRTLQLHLCDQFVVVTAHEGNVICEECHLHRLRHNGVQVVGTKRIQKAAMRWVKDLRSLNHEENPKALQLYFLEKEG